MMCVQCTSEFGLQKIVATERLIRDFAAEQMIDGRYIMVHRPVFLLEVNRKRTRELLINKCSYLELQA